MSREINIVEAIRRRVNAAGGHVIKTHGSIYSSGQPDLMGCWRNGRMLVIEVKQPGKEPTDQQRATVELWKSKGAIAFWDDSVDGILQRIEQIDRGTNLSGKYSRAVPNNGGSS